MSTGWPYDAIQDDPLTALRIPVVRSAYPGWKYEVCLLVSEPDEFGPEGLWGPALRPDEAEVRQIVAYIGYRMDYYNEGWKARMRQRPLDTDATTNTVVLVKRGEGDWQYRRCSWQSGPVFIGTGLSLPQLLDRINGFGNEGEEPNPKWEAWKDAHPEAFGGEDAHPDGPVSPFARRTVTGTEWTVCGYDELGFACLDEECPDCTSRALIVNEMDAAECTACSWREVQQS